MSNLYENIPQRIGNAERETAVERLRSNLNEGRLDPATYQQRVQSALAATTQDDLEPLFQDLPPVVTAPTYELYPHQSMASTMPTMSMPDTSPYVTPPRMQPIERFGAAPIWVKIIVAIVFLSLMGTLFRYGGWWILFFFPGIFGWWGRSNGARNRENRQRRY